MDAGFLSNKTILILSPQAWGNMMLAKHHYALELAKRGNEVYFLNPPDNDHWSWGKGSKRIIIRSSSQANLFIIEQKLYFPYDLKFHGRWLYNRLIRKQIRDILRIIPRPVDLIWSFDLGNLFPLSFFSSRIFKVFHPVDEPQDGIAILAAKGAHILFSVTKEITEKYKHLPLPAHIIHHGLADEFLSDKTGERNDRIKAGMSGNLLRADLDRINLLRIIEENPEVEFHFYGSYAGGQSNIGAATDQESIRFIEKMKSAKNTVLHGVLPTTRLAEELNGMDLLLICYDINRDQSRGTNYHKVMEYLSTGKVIVSNNISSFAGEPELVRMTAGRTDNKGFSELFRETVRNLDTYNVPALKSRRIEFARDNTYSRQLNRIEEKISQMRENN